MIRITRMWALIKKYNRDSPNWLGHILIQLMIVIAMLVVGAIELIENDVHYKNSYMPYLGDFDVVGIYAFMSLVVQIGFLPFLRSRQRVYSLVCYFLLYTVSYASLSTCGRYHASKSGRYRWNYSIAVVDQDLWHAKGVFWQPFVDVSGDQTYHATYLGYFYSPLIKLDRLFWHDSVHYFEDDVDAWLARHSESE